MKVVLFFVGIGLKCFCGIGFGKCYILIFVIGSLIFVKYLKIYIYYFKFVYF